MRIVHVVVVYGYQGADSDSDKLSVTDLLFQAVLCELSVVGQGHPPVNLARFQCGTLQDSLFGSRDLGGFLD